MLWSTKGGVGSWLGNPLHSCREIINFFHATIELGVEDQFNLRPAIR